MSEGMTNCSPSTSDPPFLEAHQEHSRCKGRALLILGTLSNLSIESRDETIGQRPLWNFAHQSWSVTQNLSGLLEGIGSHLHRVSGIIRNERLFGQAGTMKVYLRPKCRSMVPKDILEPVHIPEGEHGVTEHRHAGLPESSPPLRSP